MSAFIDKLERLSRGEAQPIGFRRTGSAAPRLKIQLVASLAQESIDQLADYVVGADAGLLRLSRVSSGAKALQKIAQAVPAIPWGTWLPGNRQSDLKQVVKAGVDFIAFSATGTPLSSLQNDDVGKILAVEASLSEGLLRAANELPVDAVLVIGEGSQGDFLTWQHLLLFQRFADLLSKPLLVSIPSKVTEGELQALWEAGVGGVITEVTPGQPRDRLKELRQTIDKLTVPAPRRREKMEPRLARPSQEPDMAAVEEEEEDEEE